MANSLTLQQVARATGGVLHGFTAEDHHIRFLLTDSRRLVFPRAALFFALKTAKNDGHRYIGELLENGVQGFVVSRLPDNKSWLAQAAFILVEDTLEALQLLAAHHRKQFEFPVIGITGSNGKTIVKEWLSQLLAEKYFVVKNPRSFNSQTGVPLSVWQMNEGHETAIFEAGISRMGEMEKLQRIIRPEWGIFTNIGPAHDEGFPDKETKIREKLQLFRESTLLIYRADNEMLDITIQNWAKGYPQLKLFRWGSAPDCNIQLVNLDKNTHGTRIELQRNNKLWQYSIPFTDDASVENLMHCIAFLHCRDLADGQLASKLQKIQPVAMRLQMRQGINQCMLIDDVYNSDIMSLGVALDFLNSQVKQKEKVLILSDILQAGISPRQLYEEVADLVKAKDVRKLIGIGPDISAHRKSFSHMDARFFASTQEFLASFDPLQFRDQGILLKGARDFEFEHISRKLQFQDHQTVMEIDLDALVHNLNVYKSMLRSGVKTTAMVKAFSYGSGSYEIAGVLQYHQVDYLAVAFADEGKELRNAGITLPIMVLNPELHNLDILFRYRLEPEIYSVLLLRRLMQEASRHESITRKGRFPIHIKLDTGMHRMGFMEEDLEELLQVLKNNEWLRVASVFSHLAAADMPQYDDFTREQILMFFSMSHRIEKELGYNFLRHIANSAAISRFPEAQMDMVRLGIGLYGVDANKDVEAQLRNVNTFKSVISQIKKVPAGHTVGYNRAGQLDRDTLVGIVPVGYADGLNRRLGNRKGYLLVNGQKAPILGNVSMDMCTIDLTGLKAAPGDEVIVFGKELPVSQLADLLGTIPYEIFTSIPARVRRVYFQE
ncbi:MAG: bifunctional UDP-N-acetylmuramoyl-tripeptide:D-alanyl-D-alanine ligase/alanine racemase [Bacteroidetes bacterium]|nr:MAG: bifunctional UDP-N-acetylmuramoyl-tripeptide:D-alanyl-D-alanine ligase/alanine racemase [Bacteroidota bacterium]